MIMKNGFKITLGVVNQRKIVYVNKISKPLKTGWVSTLPHSPLGVSRISGKVLYKKQNCYEFEHVISRLNSPT